MKKLLLTLAFLIAPTVTFANTVNCMAETIYFETLGASYEEKLAVAQITMNRVNHSRFPNNVCSVVYQKSANVCQYSWACNKNRKIKNQKEYKIAVEIARKAVSGKVMHTQVYKSKALFFHARRINPRWKLRRVYADRQHVFYTYNS